MAANSGSFAEISEWPLHDSWFPTVVITGLILAILSIVGCIVWPLLKRQCMDRGKLFGTTAVDEIQYERAVSLSEQPEALDAVVEVTPGEIAGQIS